MQSYLRANLHAKENGLLSWRFCKASGSFLSCSKCKILSARAGALPRYLTSTKSEAKQLTQELMRAEVRSILQWVQSAWWQGPRVTSPCKHCSQTWFNSPGRSLKRYLRSTKRSYGLSASQLCTPDSPWWAAS